MAIANDFECDDGHVTERMVRSGQRRVKCHCGKLAHVVYLSRAKRRASEHITPTVYYENAEGEIWSGPDAVTPCPLDGYIRREVGQFEVRQFERLMSRRMQDEHRERLEQQRESTEAYDKMRADVRKQLDEEVLHEAQGWDAEHRAILHHALEHREQPEFTRNYSPEFGIAAWNN